MNKCNRCKKDKSSDLFCENNKKFKTCFDCRSKTQNWRENNKEVVSLYNKAYNDKQLDNTEVLYVYAKKKILKMNGSNLIHN